jgi:hypothetical protein
VCRSCHHFHSIEQTTALVDIDTTDGETILLKSRRHARATERGDNIDQATASRVLTRPFRRFSLWTIAWSASRLGRIPETGNSQRETSEMFEHFLRPKEVRTMGLNRAQKVGRWKGLSASCVVVRFLVSCQNITVCFTASFSGNNQALNAEFRRRARRADDHRSLFR